MLSSLVMPDLDGREHQDHHQQRSRTADGLERFPANVSRGPGLWIVAQERFVVHRAIRCSQLVLMSVVHATFESWPAGVSNVRIWRLRSSFSGLLRSSV